MATVTWVFTDQELLQYLQQARNDGETVEFSSANVPADAFQDLANQLLQIKTQHTTDVPLGRRLKVWRRQAVPSVKAAIINDARFIEQQTEDGDYRITEDGHNIIMENN